MSKVCLYYIYVCLCNYCMYDLHTWYCWSTASCYWSLGSVILGMTSYASKLIYSNSSQTQREAINRWVWVWNRNELLKDFVESRSEIILLLGRVERISYQEKTHTLLSTACAGVIVFILGCNSTQHELSVSSFSPCSLLPRNVRCMCPDYSVRSTWIQGDWTREHHRPQHSREGKVAARSGCTK